MRVGDLRVFKPCTFYANNMFVVTHVDPHDCSVRIRIIKTGKMEWWDRITLFHDSEKIK